MNLAVGDHLYQILRNSRSGSLLDIIGPSCGLDDEYSSDFDEHLYQILKNSFEKGL